MKLVFVLLVFGNTLVLLSAAAEERISFLKKLRLLQGRPLGLDYCLCPSIYMPVCASDQKTYSNACKARCKTKVITMSQVRPFPIKFQNSRVPAEGNTRPLLILNFEYYHWTCENFKNTI